jgi:nucleotide-binding universal stress UspA family protein
MFQRILVPLDGSKRAERAIPVATRIARAAGGSVIVVQVVSTDIGLYLVPQPTLTGQIIDAEEASAEKYLRDIATSINRDGVPTETEALFGSPTSTILSFAHSHHADLIVLCSHGYTGVARWVLGSVAEKVVRHAPVPVLVLREGGPVPADESPTRPLRALVPLDGSTRAKAAIEPAASLIAGLAAPAQGALHLVRVVKPVIPERAEKDPEAREHCLYKAKRYLNSTVEHLREGLVAPAVADLKLPVTWSVAVDTDVAEAIVRVAVNGEDAEGVGVFGGCDIIAMATHGREGLQHWTIGSITERVLHTTKLPLLIVRPPDMMEKSSLTWEKTALSAIQG